MCKISTNCKCTVLGCLMLLCTAKAHAQTLKIQVTDADTKTPIEFANVAWKPIGSEIFKN